MATKQSTADYILDQLISVGEVSVRKMFGEYALYCDHRVVGLICDDTLFVKITEPGKTFVGDFYEEGLPYKGARRWMVVDGDRIEDHEWLRELVRITADNVPLPKPKKAKRKVRADFD